MRGCSSVRPLAASGALGVARAAWHGHLVVHRAKHTKGACSFEAWSWLTFDRGQESMLDRGPWGLACDGHAHCGLGGTAEQHGAAQRPWAPWGGVRGLCGLVGGSVFSLRVDVETNVETGEPGVIVVASLRTVSSRAAGVCDVSVRAARG